MADVSSEEIRYLDLPESLRERMDALSELVGDVYHKAAEHGTRDVVVRVRVTEDRVQAAAFDRAVYQNDVLRNDPKEAAEEGSFFETLNEGVAGGFWVVLHVDTEAHEYLYRMVVGHSNLN